MASSGFSCRVYISRRSPSRTCTVPLAPGVRTRPSHPSGFTLDTLGAGDKPGWVLQGMMAPRRLKLKGCDPGGGDKPGLIPIHNGSGCGGFQPPVFGHIWGASQRQPRRVEQRVVDRRHQFGLAGNLGRDNERRPRLVRNGLAALLVSASVYAKSSRGTARLGRSDGLRERLEVAGGIRELAGGGAVAVERAGNGAEL